MWMFLTWWRKNGFTEEQRIAYFRKYPPPARWLKWMIEIIWDVRRGREEDDSVYAAHFDRIEALGFGSRADFECDMNAPGGSERGK